MVHANPSAPRSATIAQHPARTWLGCFLALAAYGYGCGFGVALGAGLEWQAGQGYRSARLPVPATGRTGFTLIDPAVSGINVTNFVSASGAEHRQNRMNGEGVAAGDFNGDGLVDLLFLRKQEGNQLFLNQGGWRFTNATQLAGIACTNQQSVGVVVGDLNGDGAPDLVLSSFGGPHACLLNDGKGHFTDFTQEAGIAGKSGGTSLALADLDGNGTLDLYFCNFAVEAILRDGGQVTTRMVNGQPVVTGRYAKRLRVRDGRMEELGDPDVVYLNDGTGRFKPLDWEKAFVDEAGRPVKPPQDLSLAVQIRDVNGDGFPDIVVCSDFQTPDHLWFGDGHGHFREASSTALRNMSYASMGVDFADLDRDGRLDFITVEMLDPFFPTGTRSRRPAAPAVRIPGMFEGREEYHRNALYHQRTDGSFAEIACFAGVAATGWSWTPIFLDVDLDGYEDLLISNGFPHDVDNRDLFDAYKAQTAKNPAAAKEMFSYFPPLQQPKFAFRNRGDLTFEDVSKSWGFDSTRVASGMVVADLDGDGDLDVILNCARGTPLVYRNETIAPRVAVRVKGRAPNLGGIGAKIIFTGGPVVQTQEIVAGGQYLSTSEPMRVFAAGKGSMQLEIQWRSGRRSVIPNIEANRIYEVDEPDAAVTTSSAGIKKETSPAAAKPWFVDASEALIYSHSEPVFDDFAQQPLLPRRLSQLGPVVRVADLNGDGKSDVVLGTGRGGQVAALLGDGHGKFNRIDLPGTPTPDDILDLAVVSSGGHATSVLAVLANYESGDPQQPAVLRWDFANGEIKPGPSLPALAGGSSPGVLALGDVNGDQAPDLFVGGRVIPKRWPEIPASRMYQNRNGQFVVDEANTRTVEGAGMVTGAVFSDINGDRTADLVVSTEMGAVRIYTNQGGKLSEWDPPVRGAGPQYSGVNRLSELTGLWGSLAVADLDHDGRPDLIVGNAGLNTAWQIWGDGKPIVAYGDLAGDGSIAVVEAVRVGERVFPWRDRDQLSVALPELTSRYSKHAEFAKATLDEVLGANLSKTKKLSCRTLASTVLWNRGDHFEAVALPAEAQWSPANAIVVSDVDGDGNPDLFLAQNDFAARPEDMRVDAGQGLWLRGDGKGGFAPVPAEISGVRVFGEQRGAAVGDFNGDGKPDLIVTQNGTKARLFLHAPSASSSPSTSK